MFSVPATFWRLRISLHRDHDHGPLEERLLEPTVDEIPKAEVILDAKRLGPGRYVVSAAIIDVTDADIDRLQCAFMRVWPSPGANQEGCCPVEIPLLVETFREPNLTQWPISTAIPLPRGLVHDLRQLTLYRESEVEPCQFSCKSRWSPHGSIQWTGIDFIARCAGGVPDRYVIRVGRSATQPSEPAPDVAEEDGQTIRLRAGGNVCRIDTVTFAGPIPEDWHSGMERSGPYLVDENKEEYAANNGAPDEVAIVENGPVKATVVARGAYASASGATKCRYVTHITAFADSPSLRVTHRTIITFDPYAEKLADLGWRLPTPIAGSARFAVGGRVEAIERRAGLGVFVHQDRHDRCWFVTTAGKEVRRSRAKRLRADGLVSVSDRRADPAALTVVLRDMHQKFPKELGVAWNDDGAELSLHFWPRHGHQAFEKSSVPPDPKQDELNANNVYKLWYAHQGELLDLRMPDDVVDWLSNFQPAAGEHYLPNTAEEHPVESARTGKPIGVAIANEFSITFHSQRPSDPELLALANVFQFDPHAIADPIWSSATRCEGLWAAADPVRHARAERAIRNAVEARANALIECSGEYGMWIYANVHDKWLAQPGVPAGAGRAQIHRVWQASHYRNVWSDWLLYLRSGVPALRLWARATSDHFLHISTIHHIDDSIRSGKRIADMYHCYATTPWGGPSDTVGHYIDPDAHRMRGLLLRDPYALETYDKWLDSLKAYSGGLASRDLVNTLGAVVSRYSFTQDADALLLMRQLADSLFATYWDTGAQRFSFASQTLDPDHPVWHRQCYHLYHELTKDPRAVQFVKDWLDAGFAGARHLGLRAFAYHATGNVGHLTPALALAHAYSLYYHDAPGDRYHGYGPAVWTNDWSYFFQEMPYFLQAVQAANVAVDEDTPPRITYPTGINTNGIALTAFVLVPAAVTQFDVRLTAKSYYTNPVFAGECEILRYDGAWVSEKTVVYGNDPAPQVITMQKAGDDTLYRIVIHSTESQFNAPFTSHPEVVEVKRLFDAGTELQNSVRCWDRQAFWVGWLDDTLRPEFEVVGENQDGYNAQPAYFEMHDSSGGVAAGRTVFGWALDMAGQPLEDFRRFKTTLSSPPPWHIYSSTLIGPIIRLTNGPDSVFLSIERDHLEKVLPELPL